VVENDTELKTWTIPQTMIDSLSDESRFENGGAAAIRFPITINIR